MWLIERWTVSSVGGKDEAVHVLDHGEGGVLDGCGFSGCSTGTYHCE